MSDTPITTAEAVNRERWLNELVKRLEPIISNHGKKMTKFRISCGFPVTKGRPSAKNAHRIGECWVADASADGTHEIFISPTLDDPAEISHVALHEMIHAVLPPGTGHKAPFAKLAKAVGLEGRPTSTTPGESLASELKEITDKITEDLGPYPHAKLDARSGKKQTTRLLKVQCPVCGYIARVTRTWLDEAGTPVCPQCQTDFIQPGEDEIEDPLSVTEQTFEYQVKGDKEDRFRIIFTKKQRRAKWLVMDYGEKDESRGFFYVGQPRAIFAEGRQDALDVITSIREGLLKPEELQDTERLLETNLQDWDDEKDDETNPLAEMTEEELEELGLGLDPEDEEKGWESLQHLDEDEEEIPDNPDSILTPEEEEEYEREEREREARIREENS